MKYLKLFENSLINIKKDLKHFQNILDLDITIKELMASLEAFHIDLETIFPILKGNENLKELTNFQLFNDELKDLKLKLSELFDTENIQTFSRLPMRWYWIYSEDATDLDIPIYILFKYYYKGKWSNINLYYVQTDIKNFLDTLSIATIEFRHVKDNKTFRWFYKTINSGINWQLEKKIFKIKEGDKYKEVKSNDETATFLPNLKWETILKLGRRTDIETFIY